MTIPNNKNNGTSNMYFLKPTIRTKMLLKNIHHRVFSVKTVFRNNRLSQGYELIQCLIILHSRNVDTNAQIKQHTMPDSEIWLGMHLSLLGFVEAILPTSNIKIAQTCSHCHSEIWFDGMCQIKSKQLITVYPHIVRDQRNTFKILNGHKAINSAEYENVHLATFCPCKTIVWIIILISHRKNN